MNRIIIIAWIIAILAWVFCLVLLIISLTDIVPDSPLREYRLIIGFGFIVISGLIVFAYQKQIKHQKDLKNPTVRKF